MLRHWLNFMVIQLEKIHSLLQKFSKAFFLKNKIIQIDNKMKCHLYRRSAPNSAFHLIWGEENE
jgi:hypothetical protein